MSDEIWEVEYLYVIYDLENIMMAGVCANEIDAILTRNHIAAECGNHPDSYKITKMDLTNFAHFASVEGIKL